MTTALRVTRDQVLAFRLEGHNLVRKRPPDALLDVVGACGLRNTPPGSAPLGLHARVDGLPPDVLDRALTDDRSLVEVLAMRISPHLVPAGDAAVFTLGALPADDQSLRVPLATLAPALDRAGLPLAEALRLATDAACAELEHGPLARGALSAGMTRRLPEALSPWCKACGSAHVRESLFRLVGVQGAFVIARTGKAATYVRTDQWLDAPLGHDRRVARAELLRRYLRCFGPSTAGHFADWAGIGVNDAQDSWKEIADRLVAVDLDRWRAWVHADNLARLESPPTPAGARLLPPYDAYLDQQDRATLLPDKSLHRRVWRTLGNPGVVLADGDVVGIWRPQKKGKQLVVTVEPFAPLSRAIRTQIEVEATSLAPHRGCATAELSFAD